MALATPPLLAAVLVLAIAATERAGRTLLPGLAPRNSAEAAGMARAASLLAYLESNQDPARIYEIDPAIISSSVLRASTLEAAVFARQVGIIAMLDHRGAFSDDRRRQAVRCLAEDIEASDIADYLTRAGDPPCEPKAENERVLQRTRDLPTPTTN
jgi:hypothetical protein